MAEQHVTSVKLYLAIFFALMVGTALTVGVAKVDLGAWNDIVMLAVAVTKAVLVILFFMHVKYSTRLTALTAAGGFLFLGILLLYTLNDYFSRGAFLLDVPGK
ncbi:MAG TPA: hypothetical protein DD490_23985 [Acidobacteria bacterium]|nr:hypothetical protein [Acidobacteriota bacterium]